MTRFLLIRHGQSEWNAQGRWQGHSDPHLSERGREEAEMAATALHGFVGVVFSSPLLRARETAEIIARSLAPAQLFIEPDLMEIDVGDFSGLTHDEIEARMPDEYRLLQEGKLTAFPGGESRERFLGRVVHALERIAHMHPDKEVLAVTHGGAIASLERHLGVHPGIGIGNLVGRWFVCGGTSLDVASDRIALADQPS